MSGSLKPIILPAGAVVRGQDGERYIIEGLLGQGGESAVYLVRDRSNRERVYALKEFVNPAAHVRSHLAFESQLLTRLDSSSLPHVYKVFENVKLQRVYMLMDYIEGKDLEALRKEQPDRRFPLPLVLALLTPVVSAISYLHRQEPPIVHRDIKPSNMIVPVGAGEAMLVDFGIAKEYVEEKTTSMFRYGTPGYAAPEQYGQGTTQRTDIYALGATFYALLTGAIPIDALVRSVGSGELQDHTLKPAHEVNPDISEAVSAVIERAMQLRKEDRYASVDEFWQELNSAALQQEDISSFADMSTAPIVVMPQDAKRPVVIKAARRPVAVRGRILIAAIAILFVLGLGVGAFALYNNNSPVAKKATVHVTRVALPLTMSVAGCPLPAFTPVPPVAPQYIQTAPAYLGRISDNVAQVSTQNQGTALCLADVRQNGAHITGKFSGLGYISTFKGTVTQDKVEFTVLIGSDRTYTFTGGIRSVGDMAGSYQVVDSAGQSMGESGIWQLVPQQPHTAA